MGIYCIYGGLHVMVFNIDSRQKYTQYVSSLSFYWFIDALKMSYPVPTLAMIIILTQEMK